MWRKLIYWIRKGGKKVRIGKESSPKYQNELKGKR